MEKNKMKVVHQNEEKKKETSKEEEVASLYGVLKELPKPEAGMKLNAAQKKWWYWFGYEFVSTNQFSKVDLMHLQDASVAMDMKCKLISFINEENKKSITGIGGVVQKFPSGATNITGYQSALKDQIKILSDVSAHFGLSIKDRSKLKAVETSAGGQLDLFEEVMKKLHG
jgi:hypothetical protein